MFQYYTKHSLNKECFTLQSFSICSREKGSDNYTTVGG